MPEIKEFIDWEFGELEGDADPGNFSGAVGSNCSLVTSPTPPTGHTRALRITQDKTNSYFRGPFFTYAVGTTCITCAYIRVGSTNFPPGNNVASFVAMIDESDNQYWELRLNTSGHLQFIDNSVTLLDSLPLLTDRWYRVEVVWQPGDSSADWAWYVTTAGQSTGAAQGSGSGADFYTTATDTDIGIYLRGEGGISAANPVTVYHAGVYVMEGVTDIEDRIGVSEGYGGDWLVLGDANGRPDLSSATPNCDESGGTGSLDDLDSGDTWSEAGDENLSTDCVYTRAPSAAAKGGGVHVPGPPADRTDVVIAGKWIWYGKSNRGAGSFQAVYGRYSSSGPLYTVTYEAAPNINLAGAYHRRIEDERGGGSPVYVPNAELEDQFVIGMYNNKTTGKSNVTSTLIEAGCFSLHASPYVRGKPSIGTFAKMWRGTLSRPL